MNVGMLWFDNDVKTGVPERVTRAARYYQKKYGQKPTLCFVHPSMLPEGKSLSSGNVEVRSMASLLPNHFWIGVNVKENGNGSDAGNGSGNGHIETSAVAAAAD